MAVRDQVQLHVVAVGDMNGELLIQRQGFSIAQNRLDRNCCAICKTEIPGRWMPPATGQAERD